MTDNFLLRQSLLLIAPLILVSFLLVMRSGYFVGKKHGKQASQAEKREKTVEIEQSPLTWLIEDAKQDY